MSVRVTTLANGLRVASDPMPGFETVSVGIWVGVGTRNEAAPANGVAHMLEHMAFKGTTTRSARQIAEEIEAVGGQMNAHTGREQTAYYVKLLKGDLALGVDILADIMLRSVFDPQELARERVVVLQELGQANDTPDDIIFDHFQETAFPGQALGRPVLGRAEIIERMHRDALVDYRRRFYGARNMVFAAAGAVDHEALVRLAERAFADLAPSAEDGHEPARYVGGAYRGEDELEQVHLVVGYPGVAYEDPDFYPATVLSTLLGGGMSSRLFQEIRERRGLCYTISAFSIPYLDSGLFGVYTGTGAREVGELTDLLMQELRSVTRAVDEEEVHRARVQLKAGLLMSLESTNARMDALASQLLIYRRPISPAETVERLEAVRETDVVGAARRIFAGRPTMAAMGPLAGLDIYERLALQVA